MAIGSGFLPDLTGGQSTFEILTLILGFAATDRTGDPGVPGAGQAGQARPGGRAAQLVPGQGGVHRGVHPRHHLRAGQLPRHPDRAGHPGGADLDLHHGDEPVRLRPAHLRPRRQPARRPAVRRGHQAGRLLAVRQHGRAGRRSPASPSPPAATPPFPGPAPASSSTRSPRSSSVARRSPAASAR